MASLPNARAKNTESEVLGMGLMGHGRRPSRIGRGNIRLNMDYRVLTLDGWLEFNHRKWGLSPLRLSLAEGPSDRPSIELVVYTDRRDRVKTPRLNPYTPVALLPTDTHSVARLERQWLSVSELVVKEFRARGVVNAVSFPPSIMDVRPWRWSKFITEVRYTYYVTFPFDLGSAEGKVRTAVRKASKLGYKCERTSQMSDVMECLEGTQERQKIDYRLSIQDLETCQRLLGSDVFRAYVCYAPNGDPASTIVILGYPGATAVDWVAGTRPDHLSSGCSQLITSFALGDVQDAGALGFDFAGANVPSVAGSKAQWGGNLCRSIPLSNPTREPWRSS